MNERTPDRPATNHGDPVEHTAVLHLERYDAFLFDMDGVVTRSAQGHGSLWKEVFDEFLMRFSARIGIPFRSFDAEADYHNFVDGKPRYDGVVAFLVSRGIVLPFGEPTDDEQTETCCGLGNKKNRRFMDRLEKSGVDLYETTVAIVRSLKQGGKHVAVVSASKNCDTVLRRAGIFELFEVMVSGREASALSLAGKPAPDTYRKAMELLGISPPRVVVFEDSVTGVQAAKAAGAGLVVGVDRAADGPALLWHGADIVVTDLGRIFLDWGSDAHFRAAGGPAADPGRD